MHLNTYSEALSTVIFKKENMRSKCSWLSAFYSLIIQSMVRIGLLELTTRTGIYAEPSSSSRRAKVIQQYMHLGVRLFIASSGIHDPLMKDYSACPASSSKEEKTNQNYHAAQMAVRRDSWELHGILSSGHCLKRIFEDRGEPLEEITNKHSHFWFSGYKVDSTAYHEFLPALSFDDLHASVEVGPNDFTSLPPAVGVERQPEETIHDSEVSMSALTNLADDFGNARS
jgi:hypothetical protein